MRSIAECTIGIVCVSLPPLRSLLAKILPSVFRSPQLLDRRSGPGAPANAAAAAAASGHSADRSSKNIRAGTVGSRCLSERFRHSICTARGNNGFKNMQMSVKSTDIMVLSSLTTSHSLYSLQSDDGPDAAGKDQDYSERLARQLSMSPRKAGVSVHISAGHHDDISHISAIMNSTASGTPPRSHSQEEPEQARRTESDAEKGLGRPSPHSPLDPTL